MSSVTFLCFAHESKVVWGHAPQGNFENLHALKLPLVASESASNNKA